MVIGPEHCYQIRWEAAKKKTKNALPVVELRIADEMTVGFPTTYQNSVDWDDRMQTVRWIDLPVTPAPNLEVQR